MDGAVSTKGIGHWHPNTYEFLYSIFLKNTSIKIIQLNELSTFLKSIGYTEPYSKTDYDWSSFPNWKPKEILLNELKSIFKKEFDLIENRLKIEFKFYTNLSNMVVINKII
jgi:hypothetical protein